MKILKEAFSETMPHWVKLALLAGKGGYVYKFPETNNVKNWQGRLRGGSRSKVNLYNAFKAANIDLNKATFVSVPIPTSVRDPHLKPPYVPIFKLRLDNTVWGRSDFFTVYAKGINDEVEVGVSGKPANKVSMKRLLELTTDFCYIDMSDKNNTINAATQQTRKDWGLYNASYGRQGVGQRNVDKSGYIVNPNRYQDKLAELKLSKLSDIMRNYYDRLIACQSALSEKIAELDVTKIVNVKHHDTNDFSLFRIAANRYNTLAQQVETTEDKDALLSIIKAYLPMVQKDIQTAEKSIGHGTQTIIADWQNFID